MSRLSHVLLPLLLALPTVSHSQGHAQDGIARNLLERAQRETQFGVSLYDEPARPGAVPAPVDQSMPITLLPPGLSPFPAERADPLGPVPAPRPLRAGSAKQDLEQLHTKQQQQQLHLQMRTREQPEALRRQESDTQQLIFERETRAQEVGAEILRRSSTATGAR
jgi:hypothetical protein